MKTDPENKNPIRALSHPEQSTDTNPRDLHGAFRQYKVRLILTQEKSGDLILEAPSPELAGRWACGRALQDVRTWELFHEATRVLSIEEIGEGHSHE